MTKSQTDITPGKEGKRRKKKIIILTKNNDIYNTRIVTSNSFTRLAGVRFDIPWAEI